MRHTPIRPCTRAIRDALARGARAFASSPAPDYLAQSAGAGYFGRAVTVPVGTCGVVGCDLPASRGLRLAVGVRLQSGTGWSLDRGRGGVYLRAPDHGTIALCRLEPPGRDDAGLQRTGHAVVGVVICFSALGEAGISMEVVAAATLRYEKLALIAFRRARHRLKNSYPTPRRKPTAHDVNIHLPV